jgi:peptide/nickel transport system permease protein
VDEPAGASEGLGVSAVEPLTTAVHARAPEPGERSERSQARSERWRLLRRRPAFIFGVIILAFWVFCGIGGERVSPYGARQTGLPPSRGPSADHLFGTDTLGRDVFSRVMVGARDVLITAPLVALLGVTAGTMLGLIAGYMRGVLDEVISRVMEAILAIPVILIGLVAITNFGSTRLVLILTVGFLFTPIVFRTVRAATLAEADLDYVTSARLRGEGVLFTMTREILPNISGPIVVEATVRVGYAVFTIATLRFITGGGDPGSPDWGNQIAQTYSLIPGGTWWPAIFPALAIASLVIAINLIADSVETVYAL